MGKLLKPSSTEQYVEKGYYHPIDALTREEAAICLAHLAVSYTHLTLPTSDLV